MPTDTELLDWLQAQIVDVIYLDDGQIIDVRGNNLRNEIHNAKLASEVIAPANN